MTSTSKAAHEEPYFKGYAGSRGALRHPGATFTIKYHQTNNAIAYATARRDLVELEQKGYLSFEVDGRTMVFKAVSTLDSLIG